MQIVSYPLLRCMRKIAEAHRSSLIQAMQSLLPLVRNARAAICIAMSLWELSVSRSRAPREDRRFCPTRYTGCRRGAPCQAGGSLLRPSPLRHLILHMDAAHYASKDAVADCVAVHFHNKARAGQGLPAPDDTASLRHDRPSSWICTLSGTTRSPSVRRPASRYRPLRPTDAHCLGFDEPAAESSGRSATGSPHGRDVVC